MGETASPSEGNPHNLLWSESEVTPTLEDLPSLPGYEGVTFTLSAISPLTKGDLEVAEEIPLDDEPTISVPNNEIPKERVKLSLSEYVGHHCCWSSKPLRTMEIEQVIPNYC